MDLNAQLSIGVVLYVQDVTDELPSPARPGVRFLAILDRASQSRSLPDGHKQRALTPRVIHHTVTSETIEELVLRRFDEVVEKAVLFSGWEGP